MTYERPQTPEKNGRSHGGAPVTEDASNGRKRPCSDAPLTGTVDGLLADLRSVVEAWPRLPETVRARIVGVVEGATASAGDG